MGGMGRHRVRSLTAGGRRVKDEPVFTAVRLGDRDELVRNAAVDADLQNISQTVTFSSTGVRSHSLQKIEKKLIKGNQSDSC